jgi:PAS domain S-box-containing protein
MPKTYDPFLVVLSVLIAVWASYDALLLAGRVKVARGTARPIWLIAGSFAMGIGIWSMHFVGMLALRLPVAVSYDVALVTLSVVMAISSAAVAFTLVSWEVVSTGSFLAGAICMGLAISGMHYTGMAAIQLPALMRYDALLAALSILIAIALPYAALRLVFHFQAPRFRHDRWLKTVPAILLGLGIVGMHYTAMAAAQFSAAPLTAASVSGHAVPATPQLAIVVTLGTAAMLGMAQLGAIISRREERVQQAEERFRLLVDGVQEYAILTLDPEGRISSWNAGVERISGYPAGEILGRHFSLFYEEPDVAQGTPQQHLKAAAERGWSEDEGWRIRKDGTRFWANVLITAVRDSAGAVVGFSLITRDVTERKRVQTELVQQRARLRALATRLEAAREEERTKLAREIHDELGQALTALQLDLNWLDHNLHDRTALKPKVQHMTTVLRDTLVALQGLAADLRPPVLDRLGLRAAILALAREFESRTGVRSRVEVTAEEVALDGDLATAIYRILQEALTNVSRHAGATRVDIVLRHTPARLELEVRDDGRGITEQELADHRSLGLLGMQERAQNWGGEVSIDGIPGQGTWVRVTIPLGEPAKRVVGI